MISYLFNEIFYRPLFNGLIFLYNNIPGHDIGIAIVALTILIRLVLWPLTKKGIRSQRILADLQPKIDEIRKKYKTDKETQAKMLMALYSENKINPLASFLPILIQIPIILALWRVFLNSMNADMSALYPFISSPESIHAVFLGIIDLTQRNMVLAVLAGALQYVQTKMVLPTFAKASDGKPVGTPDFGRIMNKQMLYFGPVLSVVIFWSLPAALPLYWTVVTVLTIIQQYFNQNDAGKQRKN